MQPPISTTGAAAPNIELIIKSLLFCIHLESGIGDCSLERSTPLNAVVVASAVVLTFGATATTAAR